jgi:streptogramin lyase
MNQPVSIKKGILRHIPVRMGILLLVLLASVGFALNILHTAHAAPITQTQLPTVEPWGIAFDGHGTTWVAEPACDETPVCSRSATSSNGAIAAVSNTNLSVAANFQVPHQNGFSGPVFVKSDGQGNIWFSMPTANTIGELRPNFSNPGASVWKAFSVNTASAGPYDLTFDTHGNLWFTEILASQIGELNPATGAVRETAIPSGVSKPYGITGPDPKTGAIWFTENLPTDARVGSFLPPATGALTTSSINEYLIPSPSSGTTPHLIASDGQGNIWVTGGFDGKIYQLAIGSLQPGTSRGITHFSVPFASATHISGIGVDSTGTVWADDSLSSRVFSLSNGNFQVMQLAPNSHPHDGVGISPLGNVFFTEEFAQKLAEIKFH